MYMCMHMHIDETAKDGREFRRVGIAPIGAPAVCSEGYFGGPNGEHTRCRLSFLVSFDVNGFIAWEHTVGTFNTETFLLAADNVIMPYVQPLPGSRSLVGGQGFHASGIDGLEPAQPARPPRRVPPASDRSTCGLSRASAAGARRVRPHHVLARSLGAPPVTGATQLERRRSTSPPSCAQVFIDNATIHHSHAFVRRVNRRGGIVIFLPPYAYDTSALDNGAFGLVRRWLERNYTYLYAHGLEAAMDKAFRSLTPADARYCFRNCGYVVS